MNNIIVNLLILLYSIVTTTPDRSPQIQLPEGFLPFFEGQSHREDGTGLMDHVTVEQDGVLTEVTNFGVIQDAFRSCVPPVKIHMSAPWTETAKANNVSLRQEREADQISSLQQAQGFILGVYMRPNPIVTEPES